MQLAMQIIPAFFVAGAIVGFLFALVVAVGSRRVAVKGRLGRLAVAGAVAGLACMTGVLAVAYARTASVPSMTLIIGSAAIYAALGAGTAALIGKFAGWKNRADVDDDTALADSDDELALSSGSPASKPRIAAERTRVQFSAS